MDFAQVEAKFKALRRDFDAGVITEEEFKAQLEELKIQDDEGRWWIIGYETGQWYYHDGENWVRGEPPQITADKVPAAPAKRGLPMAAVVAITALVVVAIGVALLPRNGPASATPTPTVTVTPAHTPSLTPTDTPTLTPTPTPTVTPASISGPFAKAWDTVSGLIGVPLAEHTQPEEMAEQHFEHGKMFWWCPDNCQDFDQREAWIVVLFYDDQDERRWELYPDTWEKDVDPTISCPEADTDADPPKGPFFGFGKLWCDEEKEIRQRLGSASDEGTGYKKEDEGDDKKDYRGYMQEFEGGFMLCTQLDRSRYVFFGDESGTWTTKEP